MNVGTLGLPAVRRRMGGMVVTAVLGAAPLGLGSHHALAQQVEVLAVQRLSPDPQPFPLVESWLTINPQDPTNLLASAMSVTAQQSVVYGSWDGGRTWSVVTAQQGSAFPDGDPTVTFDAAGRAWFGTTAFNIWRSTDGGHTWGAPAWTGSGHAYDRDWLAAGPPMEKGAPPTVYDAVRRAPEAGEGDRPVIEFVASRDGGVTFSSHAVVLDSGYINAVMPPVVRRDGSVVLPILVNYAKMPGNREMYRGRRLVLISHDGGHTWGEPHTVAENIQFGNSVGDQAWKGLGIGSLAVDQSGGPFDGTLYMAWASVLNNRIQVLLSRSTDDGIKWGVPSRVNDGGLSSNHSLATVAVNPDGVVALIWNDRRDDPSDRCFRPYVAVSIDGGQNIRAEPGHLRAADVSGRRTMAERGRHQRARGAAGRELSGYVDCGDGTGSLDLDRGPSAPSRRGLQALRSDARSGVFQLWTTTVDPPES